MNKLIWQIIHVSLTVAFIVIPVIAIALIVM